MNFISKFQIVYDKNQLDGQITKAKSSIEKKLKVKLDLGTSDGGNNKAIASLEKQVTKLETKIKTLTKARQQAKMAIDEEAVASARLVKWQAQLDVKKTKNSGFFSGGSDDAKEATSQIKNVEKAMAGYAAEATKVNRLNVGKEMDRLSIPMANANKQIFSMGDMLGQATKKFAAFMSITQVAWMAMRAFKLMFDNVKQLDASLIELQKVSNLTGSSLTSFTDRAFEAANKLGRTGTSLIDATTSFKRAGYSLNESFQLGQQALLMMNIGDGIENVETASKVLISTLKAFNLTAKDSEMVLDSINEVSNNSAVSFSDLAEGLRIASGVFATSGDDIQQLEGMLTATDTVMQDMSTSANALKVISLRMRGVKTDAEDSAPSLTRLSKAFSEVAQIDMFDANGQIRTMSSILDELSPKWDTLTINQKNFIAEQAGGKHRIGQFLALMNNYDEKIKATALAYDSMGSASEENERYMGGLEAKLNELSSAFQSLSASTLDSGVLKFILSLGKVAIDTAKFLNVWVIALVASGVAINKWNTGFLKKQVLDRYVGQVQNLGAAMQGMTTPFKSATAGINAAGKAITGFSGAAAALLPMLGIMAVTMAFKAIEASIVTLSEAKEEVTNLTETISTLKSEFDSLNSKEGLTSEERDRLEFLKMSIALQERELEIKKKSAFDKQFTEETNILKGMAANWSEIKDLIFQGEGEIEAQVDAYNNTGRGDKAVSFLIEKIEELQDANKSLATEMKNGEISVEDASDAYTENSEHITKNKQRLLELNEALKSGREAIGNNDGKQEYYQDLIDSMDRVLSSTDVLLDADGRLVEANEKITMSAEEAANAQTEMSTVMSDLKTETELLTSAWNEQNSNGYLSADTVMKMVDAGAEYIAMLQLENGNYVLNKQAAMDLFEQKKQIAIADINIKKQEIEMQIAAIQATISSYSANNDAAKGNALTVNSVVNAMVEATKVGMAALGETANATVKATSKANKAAQAIYKKGGMTGLQNSLKDAQGQLQKYDTALGVLNNLTLPSYTGTQAKAGNATEKSAGQANKLADANEALKNTIDALKDSLEREKNALADMKSAYEAMQGAIVKQLEKEIALQEKKIELIETQKKIFEAQQDAAVKVIEAEIKALQDKMNALDKEKEVQDEILKLQEAQLAADKAKDAYEQAKNNKNTRVYSESGGWEWKSDPQAVEDAKNELEDALKDLKDIQDAQALDKKKYDFQQQIDELEKLKESWGANLDDIFDDIKNHEDVLKFQKDFENATLEERKALLEDFTKKYGTEVVQQNKDTDTAIKKLQELKEQWSKSMDIQEDLSKYAGAQDWLKQFENATYETRKGMLGSFTASWVSNYSQQQAKIADLERQIENESATLKRNEAASNAASGATGGVGGAASGAVGGVDSLSGSINNATTKTKSWWEASLDLLKVLATDGLLAMTEKFIANGQVTASKSKKAYATGGILETGGSGIVNYTGDMQTTQGTVQVDGAISPEVMLNHKQQANLLFQMANNPSRTNTSTKTNNNNSSIVIQSVNITAKNNDTLSKLMTEVKQRVQINK